MKISQRQFLQIKAALLESYTRAELQQVVRLGLNLSLDAITGGGTDSDVVFDLIEWAERNDRLLHLIQAAAEYNNHNQLLQQLLHDASDWFSPVPHLANAQSFLHQLPPLPQNFIGREAEIQFLRGKLEDHQAIAIYGMGGVGKTTLAIALADECSRQYNTAQLFITVRTALSGPLTATEVMARVIRAFLPDMKVPEDDDELASWYRSLLHDHAVVLLLDNVDSMKQVMQVMPPRHCRLLVTSHNHLVGNGLFSYQLESLPVIDAKTLLIAVAPGAAQEADPIVQICGCLPLTLTLAGGAIARSVDITPAEYVDQLNKLEGRLELAEAVVRLSYNLLSTKLQGALRLLAVFPDAFDFEAAAAVWAEKPLAARNLLGQLVAASLLEWNHRSLRYHLHHLVHDFLNTRLSKPMRLAAMVRYARHFVAAAVNANEYFRTYSSIEALVTFDSLWQHVRATHSFLLGCDLSDRLQMLVDLHVSIDTYCDRRGLWHEHIIMLQNTIQALEVAAFDRPSIEQLKIQLGDLQRRQLTDLDAALAGFSVLPGEMPSQKIGGRFCRRVGDIYRARGDFSLSFRCYDIAERLITEALDRGKLLSSVAEAYARSGRSLDKAMEAATESLATHQKIGDKYEIAQSCRVLADVYLSGGNLREARHYIGLAETTFREITPPNNPILGWTLRTKGEVHRLSGEERLALECYEQALTIFRKQDVHTGIAIMYAKLGILQVQSGNAQSGLRRLDEAVEMAYTVKGAKFLQAQVLLSRYEASLSAGLPDPLLAARLSTLLETDEDLAVLYGHFAYLQKRYSLLVGVATSISADRSFDPLDSLSYVINHSEFRLVQVFLNKGLLIDPPLQRELVMKAMELNIGLICHAPDLLRPEPALNSLVLRGAHEILGVNPQKWVVYHFDQRQQLSDTVDLITALIAQGLTPCIENFHYEKSPEAAQQHYESFLELFSHLRTNTDGNVCAVLDIPRLFDAELGLTLAQSVELLYLVYQRLEALNVPVILHLIDSVDLNMQRSHWCPLGTGAIPYRQVLPRLFALQIAVPAVVFEYEDKDNPAASIGFLEECLRLGIMQHHPALAVKWWG